MDRAGDRAGFGLIFGLPNRGKITQARNRLTKYGGDDYEETCVTFCCFVLHERLYHDRQCDWYQHRRRRSAVLHLWAALLGAWSLLVLGSGALGLASPPSGLDPRALQTLLIAAADPRPLSGPLNSRKLDLVNRQIASESGLKSRIRRQIFGLPAQIAIFLAQRFGWAAAVLL